MVDGNMTRFERLLQSYKSMVKEFGDPERSMVERRKMLKELRDMEQELDRRYRVDE
jgi:hypothetical protein